MVSRDSLLALLEDALVCTRHADAESPLSRSIAAVLAAERSRSSSFRVTSQCPACHGNRCDYPNTDNDCPSCGGTGLNDEKCPQCPHGDIPEGYCSDCTIQTLQGKYQRLVEKAGLIMLALEDVRLERDCLKSDLADARQAGTPYARQQHDINALCAANSRQLAFIVKLGDRDATTAPSDRWLTHQEREEIRAILSGGAK